jgi:hypothetical protein
MRLNGHRIRQSVNHARRGENAATL